MLPITTGASCEIDLRRFQDAIGINAATQSLPLNTLSVDKHPPSNACNTAASVSWDNQRVGSRHFLPVTQDFSGTILPLGLEVPRANCDWEWLTRRHRRIKTHFPPMCTHEAFPWMAVIRIKLQNQGLTHPGRKQGRQHHSLSIADERPDGRQTSIAKSPIP